MRTRADMFGPQAGAARAAVERGGKLAMFLDLGDGKTGAALHALRDLDAFPALVVAPATVVSQDEWGREAGEWQDTRGLCVVPLTGDPARRKRRLGQDVDVFTVSYDNLLWLTQTVNIAKRFRAIVFDELSKMKAPGTRRFKRMRRFTPAIDVRLGLTGHPTANHMLDIWGEVFLIAGPEPLGPTYSEFRDRWFKPSRYVQTPQGLQAVDWQLLPGAMEDIKRRVAPYVYCRPADAPVNKPEVRTNIVRVPMPRHAEALSDKLMRDLWCEFPNGATLEVLAGSQIGGKLRQIAGGAVYTEGGRWEDVHDAKLRALDAALDELQGEPALVVYWFKHEQERIAALLDRRKTRWNTFENGAGGWNDGQYEALLVHPQSVAYGLNLQRGGHHVLWYSSPWSYDLWMQLNGRLARPGQRAPWVTATQFECGPADAMVAEALLRKGAVEREFMEGL